MNGLQLVRPERRGTPTATFIPQIIKENQSDIFQIDLTTPDGVTTILKNPDNTWSFPSSTNPNIDQGKVQELLSDIYFLTPINTLDSTVPLDTFGLLKPT